MNASAKPDKQKNVEKWLEINYCQLDCKRNKQKTIRLWTNEKWKSDNTIFYDTFFAFYE